MYSKIIASIMSVILMIISVFNPNKGTFTVKFLNYDNSIISEMTVNKGNSVEPPENPEKSGEHFLGWQGNYINVEKNEVVKAIFDDEKNVFVISSTTGNIGDIVSILVRIDGRIKICGFDMTILYDSALELVSVDDDLDLDIISNTKAIDNGVILNFSSATNKTKPREIIKLNFKIKETTQDAVSVSADIKAVKEVSGNTIVDTPYAVVNGVVWVN